MFRFFLDTNHKQDERIFSFQPTAYFGIQQYLQNVGRCVGTSGIVLENAQTGYLEKMATKNK